MSNEITQAIAAIRDDTRNALDRIGVGSERVQSGSVRVFQMGESLNSTLDRTNQLNGEIERIAAATAEQASTCESFMQTCMGISGTLAAISGASQMIGFSINDLHEKIAQLRDLTKTTGFEVVDPRFGESNVPDDIAERRSDPRANAESAKMMMQNTIGGNAGVPDYNQAA